MEQRSARMEYLHWNQILVALLVTILFSLWSKLEAEKANLGGTSWPVHHLTTWSPNNKDRKKKYDEFMQGCREMYEDVCDSNERDRTEMNLRQPQSKCLVPCDRHDERVFCCDLQKDVIAALSSKHFLKSASSISPSSHYPLGVVNYTKTGFVKVPAPKELKDILTEFWELNKDKKAKENVRSTINGGISTRTNHWKSETYMVSVEDTSLEGAGYGLKVKLWMAARDVVEEWTGMKLQPASIYGIRVYTDGAILVRPGKCFAYYQIRTLTLSMPGRYQAPHVDRLPLVSSCIVNIAQDVDEPWPLEVIDRQGKAVNITMEPGEFMLNSYQQCRCIHIITYPLYRRYDSL